METKGTGRISPGDTDEFIEITVEFNDGEAVAADFSCSQDEVLKDCGRTVCRMILGHSPEDIMQVTNNVVFYNTDNKIPTSKLYLGAMAVMATKRAVADWGKKNGIVYSPEGGCSCY